MSATALPAPPNHPSSMDCDQQPQGLQDHAFTPYHNDVSLIGRQAFIEAYHIVDLYNCYTDKHNCPNLDKGTQWGGACGRTKYLIYTNTSEGPIDQASELVDALRAERTNGQG
jgi:hypothetical protein